MGAAFAEAGLVSLKRNGDELLAMPPRLNAWRAATDNDGIKGRPNQERKPSGFWIAAGLDKLEIETSAGPVVKQRDGSALVVVKQVGRCAGGAIRLRCEYGFSADGGIICRHAFDVDEALRDLPRLGITMQLRPGLEQLRWFGRGPHESYCDRLRGARVGL